VLAEDAESFQLFFETPGIPNSIIETIATEGVAIVTEKKRVTPMKLNFSLARDCSSKKGSPALCFL